jgi:hypothetical protein
MGKAFEIQDMKLAIVCTEVEKVNTAFGTAGKESVAKRGVSDSDKVFVEAHVVPRQQEKKFELDAEKMGTLLGTGPPVPMIAGKLDVLEDGVVVVVCPAVDKYSAAEIELTPG